VAGIGGLLPLAANVAHEGVAVGVRVPVGWRKGR
jgi:hypothetical protein